MIQISLTNLCQLTLSINMHCLYVMLYCAEGIRKVTLAYGNKVTVAHLYKD